MCAAAIMNQVIQSLPLETAGYSLPSEQECIDHIGANAHHSSYASGGAEHLSRDGVLNQSGSNLPSLPLGGGARYMTYRSATEAQYQTGAGISDSSSGSISTSPSSNASSLAFQPFSASNVFQQSAVRPLSLANTYPTSSSLFASPVGYPPPFGLSNMRPRLSMADPSNSGMLPPTRTQAVGTPVSPSSLGATARENYTTSTPGLSRHTLSPRSHAESLSRLPYSSLPDTPRSVLSTTMALSPSSSVAYGSASASMLNYQTQHNSQPDTPPFNTQENFVEITADNTPVQPHIEAKIEKGFFYSSDSTWTCYRRNYFSVLCSYSLHPHISDGRLFVNRPGKHAPEQIQALAITITAAVDGSTGKSIELVQHTPKRDKEPRIPIKKEKIWPTPPGKSATDVHGYSLAAFHNTQQIAGPYLPLQNDGESSQTAYSSPSHTAATHQHTFERIQFKSATANNGKRRAQQQYYHVIVELWADIRQQHDSQPIWVKVAHRLSAAVVVRGRSPSHYQNEGPHSASSRGGPGGTGSGAGGTGGSGFGGAGGASMAGRGLGNGLSMLTGNGLGGRVYRGSQYSLDPSPVASHSVSSASSISGAGPLEGLASETQHMDESNNKPMSGFEGYQYYPSPLHDAGLFPPARAETSMYHEGRRIKDEYTSHPLGSQFALRSGCGTFQATDTSRGFYPDLNMTTGY